MKLVSKGSLVELVMVLDKSRIILNMIINKNLWANQTMKQWLHSYTLQSHNVLCK